MKFVHVTAALELGGAELMLRRLRLTERSQDEPPANVVSLRHGREGVTRTVDAGAQMIRETGPR